MASHITPIRPGEPHYVGSEILVTEHFVDEAGCREIMAYTDAHRGNPAYVGDPQEDGMVRNTYTDAFIADRVDVIEDPPMADRLNRICEDYYRQLAEPYYGIEVEWFEVPHLLRYAAGGKCTLHADAENWKADEYRWLREIDRDYSSVIYFNSDYSGGGLAFPDLNIRVTPGNGMVVTFPSDHRFIHEVEPVTAGVRYSCVMWAAATGTDRCNRMITEHIIRLRQPQASSP